ncbi:MAG: transporter substrate-binding domain-containing protein [Holophagales bacterium]|nr:transporter substrate-binding domain-containing protein [Holophagales bacterium]MYG31846.1 transporter substrate-binding domain-containing protein [Holophagales bacterium]MYI79688.1 transporter substrate-binding domain-containing protein [Holophagales bacterium]
MAVASAARRPMPAAGALALFLAVVPAPAEELRVCLVEDDLPRADRAEGTGFDHDLFREAAERLGRDFVPVWRPKAPPYSEIDDTDLPFEALLERECDLAPSVPGQLALGRLAGAVDLSPPYYAAAFEIYMPAAESLDWAGLPEAVANRKVAVRLQSLGHFAAQAAGLDWTSQPSAADVVGAVDDGRAAAALIFGPALASLGRDPVSGFEPPPGLRFNEHAAVRAGDVLGDDVTRVLEDLRRDGTLARLAARYGIFRIEPFPTVSSPEAIRALGIGGP